MKKEKLTTKILAVSLKYDKIKSEKIVSDF